MPYARVNMAEFKSREEMHKVIINLGDNMKSVFPGNISNITDCDFSL